MVFGSHFIFDGTDSRDYNLFLCSFDGAQEENLSMGLGIEAITMELRDNTIDYGGKYNEVLTFQFSACLDDRQGNKVFDRKQVREIVNWLSSKELKWLSFYDEDDVEYWYFCRFTNIETKKFCGQVIGFNFEVTCDSPYAYSDIKIVKINNFINHDATTNGLESVIYKHIFSDTDIYVCPNIFIELNFNAISILQYTKVDILIDNRNIDTIYQFKLENFPTNSDGYGGYRVMIDLNNWIVCRFTKKNNILTPNYNSIIKNIQLHALNPEPSEKLLKLLNGDNQIGLTFRSDEEPISNNIFNETNFSVYLQYREKYKVGVF